jgi:ribulose-phosphate 3-epimerase
LTKLTTLRRRIDAHVARGGQSMWLEVDGGVKVGNIRAIAEAGADTFVAGSAIFGARNEDGGFRSVIGAMRRELAAATAAGRAA